MNVGKRGVGGAEEGGGVVVVVGLRIRKLVE
jgi:hypothetical protein